MPTPMPTPRRAAQEGQTKRGTQQRRRRVRRYSSRTAAVSIGGHGEVSEADAAIRTLGCGDDRMMKNAEAGRPAKKAQEIKRGEREGRRLMQRQRI